MDIDPKDVKVVTEKSLSPDLQLIKDGGQVVKTETFYQTAITVQKPRDIDDIVSTVQKECKYMGERGYYVWRQGDGVVEGPSVIIGMAIARAWGNCAVSAKIIDDTASDYYLEGHFVDLETGFNISRPFKQSKTKKMGKKMDTKDNVARKDEITLGIGASKTTRNVIVRGGVPGWLVDDAISWCKEAVEAGIETMGVDQAKKLAVQYLATAGVAEDRIVAVHGPKAKWTSETIGNIRGQIQAIKDKQSTYEEEFPYLEAETPKSDDDVSAPTEHKEKIRQTDDESADDKSEDVESESDESGRGESESDKSENAEFIAASQETANKLIEEIKTKDTDRKLGIIEKKIKAMEKNLLPQHRDAIHAALQKQITSVRGETKQVDGADPLTEAQIQLLKSQLGPVSEKEFMEGMGVTQWNQITDIMDGLRVLGNLKEGKTRQLNA
jgi:hypothetical protein